MRRRAEVFTRSTERSTASPRGAANQLRRGAPAAGVRAQRVHGQRHGDRRCIAISSAAIRWPRCSPRNAVHAGRRLRPAVQGRRVRADRRTPGCRHRRGRAGSAIARMQRSSAHYFQRPDKDYALYDPTRTSLPGYKVGAGLERSSGRHWLWSIVSTTTSRRASSSTTSAGSAPATACSSTATSEYRETMPGKIFRSYSVGVRQSNEWNFGGDHGTAQSTRVYANLTWRNFWTTPARPTRRPRRRWTPG